jgi:predicted transcriptional regulator
MSSAAETTPDDAAAAADGIPAVRLGALEAKIMDLLWDTGPATARQLQQGLNGRTPAATTVLTVLAHLHEKGLVTRERGGRAHRYHAALSREDHLAGLMRATLTTAPDPGAVLNRFIDTISPADTATLRQLLR